MRAVVVYESLFGNTAAIARAIAEGIGSDTQALTTDEATDAVVAGAEVIVRMRPTPLLPRLSDDERAAHRAFVATLGEKAIWKEYLPAADPTAEPPPVANQA